jgi:hypothetical protein
MEDVGIFYGHLVYFTAIWYMYAVAFWYILRFFFSMLYQEKSGNPESNYFDQSLSNDLGTTFQGKHSNAVECP